MQQFGADRHADHGAEQKRQQPCQLYRPAQLPDRDPLHDQSIRGDQRRHVSGRQEMQPYRRGDNAKSKARYAGHKSRCEGPSSE